MSDRRRLRERGKLALLGFIINLCLEATLANRICEILYQFTGIFPADTRVRDA